MLFAIGHVLSLELVCSFHKLMSSVYGMMHTSIIHKNVIVMDIIIVF